MSSIDINLPRRVHKGLATGADWGNSVRDSIHRLASRFDRNGNPIQGVQEPPFWPTLRVVSGSPATFKVSVSKGYVCETNLTIGEDTEALNYFIVEDLTGGYPTEFDIALDEAVFVVVEEGSSGAVLAAGIEVLSKTTKSKNYIEGVQDGVYYYKLAQLVTGPSGQPELELLLAGSHIYKTSGLTADVLIEDCSGDPWADPVVDGAMLIRMSFISGKLVSLNDSTTSRPFASQLVREQFEPCSFAGDPT